MDCIARPHTHKCRRITPADLAHSVRGLVEDAVNAFLDVPAHFLDLHEEFVANIGGEAGCVVGSLDLPEKVWSAVPCSVHCRIPGVGPRCPPPLKASVVPTGGRVVRDETSAAGWLKDGPNAASHGLT
jgi:hypothetical protein